MTSVSAAEPGRRPVFGLRREPGRLALWAFRLPLVLYRHGWGRMLGRTFLMFVHVGRTTGQRHQAVAMVLGDNRVTGELTICSGWGPRADWVRNLRAGPAVDLHIGRDRFVPVHRFMDEDQAVAIGLAFRQHHPYRLRLISTILGWGDLRGDEAVRRFVQSHPVVAFRPADARAAE